MSISGETVRVVMERKKLPKSRRGIRAFLEEQQLKLDEMLSEGTLGQVGFDPNDDIGLACRYLEMIRNGCEASLFCLN